MEGHFPFIHVPPKGGVLTSRILRSFITARIASLALHGVASTEASPLAIHYTNTGSAVIIEALVRGSTKWMIAVAITYTLAQAKNTTV